MTAVGKVAPVRTIIAASFGRAAGEGPRRARPHADVIADLDILATAIEEEATAILNSHD